MTLFDHCYVFLVVVAFPVYAKFSFKAVIEEIRRGGEKARQKVYRQTIVTWLMFAALITAFWATTDRSWSDLGIVAGDPVRQVVAMLIAAAAIVAFWLPLKRAVDRDRGAAIAADLGDLFLFMPRTANDEKWFRFVALNAGITEELIMRGYLFWYLANYFSTFAAAVIAVAAFAYAHIYQGPRQLPGLVLISTVAVGLYLYSGSLLVPVLFHVIHDAVQGHYLARLRGP